MKPERTDSIDLPSTSRETSLLEGIISEAREEASRLLDEAKEQAKSKRSSAEAEGKRILSEAERRSEEQRSAILKEAESSTAAEARRITLRGREKLYDRVMTLLRERMRKFAAGDEYPRILRDWIIEAVLGLGSETVVIEAPRRERSILSEEFLTETTRAIRELTGRETSLSVTDAESGDGNPGITVYNETRNLAFDNRLEARIRRRRREIMRSLRDALDPPQDRRKKEN
jgi:vacuolar-type H+-ATPase subunit E/Vma4